MSSSGERNFALEAVFNSKEAQGLTRKAIAARSYFFVSFDLVDSTKLKRKPIWVKVLWHFFDAVTTYAKGDDFYLWKYRGDEALFFKPLDDSNDSAACVESVYKITDRLNTDFQNEDFDFDVLVKTTAWVGVVHELPPGSFDSHSNSDPAIAKENILLPFESTTMESGGSVEFLGEDIDMGFRIAEAASPNALTLSLQLAYLFLNNGRYKSKVRLVGHRKLKGVGDGIYWPVLWYSSRWASVTKKLRSKSSTKDMLQIAALDFNREISIEDLKVFISRYNLKENIERLERLAKMRPEPDNKKIASREGALLSDRSHQLHCVAVCFNSRGEVLLGRRKKKEHSPLSKKWEFGCAQLNVDIGFEESIRRDYLHDFGVEIIELCERPVKCFTVDGKSTPGIIFVAIIKDDVGPKANKHEKVLLSSREFFKFNDSECVSGFFDTWDLAQEILNDSGVMNG